MNVEEAVVKIVEKQLDEALDRADRIEDKELDRLRKERLAQLKKRHEDRQLWKDRGHGKLNEITKTLDFFDSARDTSRVVVLFYPAHLEQESAAYITKLLETMADRHIESKFLRANISKLDFLKQKLNVADDKCTIAIVIDSIVRGYIPISIKRSVALKYDELEWELESAGAIDLDEDAREKKSIQKMKADQRGKKTIKDRAVGKAWARDDSDDSE
ncbi:hypothetical protein GJ496_001375 [Pomphorhynchus laevis]|nr:hypothetical protein GJ496_001375 [Pomphorhynchus laevis]